MELKRAFGIALRDSRKARHLKQEDFGGVSSQTYLSQLEAGAKGPTLEKTHDLASVMGVHPLTILARCYLLMDDTLTLDQLFERVRAEIVGNSHS
ncbi:TPA: helix-turn-helix transcriptional regulator [Pseudomonas aeruginosa]|uniref:Helix-turn-helix domain-containing protein n=1 Tax=Pseudomonas extremaustralis TaxID=359110 RepID=A0A5C5Q3V4_9PSED|nr:helix-turn-helix transcriptional regulator [Pseudomonas extremaustralis]EZI24051.1 XRE family transcriptional regulator [Pseudomonas extremaustralis 14-3 substr. 14-3b]TWR99879.1 helix-turn-helix transcriptional regulator [Pseudomonas extremaustralis]SDF55731.1 Helix-turn-helix domain-containing protein [Pseudomonas extremaustralis]